MSGISALSSLSDHLIYVASQPCADLEFLDCLLQDRFISGGGFAKMVGAEPENKAGDMGVLMERAFLRRILIATFQILKQNVALVLAAHGLKFEICGRQVTPKVPDTPCLDLVARAKKALALAVAVLDQLRQCMAQIGKVPDGLVIAEVCRRMVIECVQHVPGAVEVGEDLHENLLPAIPKAALLRILDEKSMAQIMAKSLAEIMLEKRHETSESSDAKDTQDELKNKPEETMEMETKAYTMKSNVHIGEASTEVKAAQTGKPESDDKLLAATSEVSEKEHVTAQPSRLSPMESIQSQPYSPVPDGSCSSSVQVQERARVDEDNQRTLFVNRVPFDCTEGELEHLFIQFGDLESIQIRTGKGYYPFAKKVFAFVKYQHASSAKFLFAHAQTSRFGSSIIKLRPRDWLTIEYRKPRDLAVNPPSQPPFAAGNHGPHEGVTVPHYENKEIADVPKPQTFPNSMKPFRHLDSSTEEPELQNVLNDVDEGTSNVVQLEKVAEDGSLQERGDKNSEKTLENSPAVNVEELQEKLTGETELMETRFDEEKDLKNDEDGGEIAEDLQENLPHASHKLEAQESELDNQVVGPQEKPSDTNEFASDLVVDEIRVKPEGDDTTLDEQISSKKVDNGESEMENILDVIGAEKDHSSDEDLTQENPTKTDKSVFDSIKEQIAIEDESPIEIVDSEESLCDKASVAETEIDLPDTAVEPIDKTNDSNTFISEEEQVAAENNHNKPVVDKSICQEVVHDNTGPIENPEPDHLDNTAELGGKSNGDSTLGSDEDKGKCSGMSSGERVCFSRSFDTSTSSSTSSDGVMRRVGGHSNHGGSNKQKKNKKKAQQRRNRAPILVGTMFDISAAVVRNEDGAEVPNTEVTKEQDKESM